MWEEKVKQMCLLPKAEIQITETLPETEVHLKRAALYLDTALFK